MRAAIDARAGIRMSQAESYLADLAAWNSGDSGRFERMVLGLGVHSTASAQRWAGFIRAIANEDYVAARHGERLIEMTRWLETSGL